MTRALLIGLLLLSASATAEAQTATADSLPTDSLPAELLERIERLNAEPLPPDISFFQNPNYGPEDPSAAPSGGDDVPPLTGRIVDLAHLLSPYAAGALTERLAAHEDSTSNQIVVLTIPSLRGAVLEEYATRVFREWGLGQADRDNGVLLLISRDDRELRIEVGYGLEGDLTDARSSEIIRNVIVPRFRAGDFETGVVAGADAIVASVEGTYVSTGSPGAARQPGLGAALFLIPTALFGLFLRLSQGGAGAGAAGLFGLFTGIFAAVGLAIWTGSLWSFVLVPIFPAVGIGVHRWIEQHPVYGPRRRIRRRATSIYIVRSQRHMDLILEARERGETHVVIDGVNRRVPTQADSGGSGSSGGWSSSSSFSGGGGSSGGGGASGSW